MTTLTGHEILGSPLLEAGRMVAHIHNSREAFIGDLVIRRQSDSGDHLCLYRVTAAEEVQAIGPVHGGGHSQKVRVAPVATIVTEINPVRPANGARISV